MRYNFKQAALLGRGGSSSRGHVYSKGVHELVDPKHKDDATFKHLSKHGLIEVFAPDAQKVLEPASSDIAKATEAASKSHLEPDAEIGGDDAAEASDDEAKPRRRRK